MRGRDLFHVGIVVPDLERALDHFGNLLNLSWTPITEVHHLLAGTTDPVRYAFSVEPPHLELIQAIPGTIFAFAEGSNLHHIGFWTDGLAHESERLVSHGCPREMIAFGEQAYGTDLFAYHLDEYHVRIELLDPRMRRGIERAIAESATPDVM